MTINGASTVALAVLAVLASASLGSASVRLKDSDRGYACREAYELALSASTRLLNASERDSLIGCDIAELRFLRASALRALSGEPTQQLLDYDGRIVSVPTAVLELTERIVSGSPRDANWYAAFFNKNGKYGILASLILFDGRVEPAFDSLVVQAGMKPWVENCGSICHYARSLSGEPTGLTQKVDYIMGRPASDLKYKIVRLAELGTPALDEAIRLLGTATPAWSTELRDWNRIAVHLALSVAGDSRYASIDVNTLAPRKQQSVQMHLAGRPFHPSFDLHWTSDTLFVENYPLAGSP